LKPTLQSTFSLKILVPTYEAGKKTRRRIKQKQNSPVIEKTNRRNLNPPALPISSKKRKEFEKKRISNSGL
jgi:hypothetical protein